MKKDFTKNQIIKSLLILAFALVSNGVFAQFQMEVTAPAGVAGTYEVRIADFGDLSGVTVTGEGASSTPADGCTAITGTTGKIAFVNRGDCQFGEKCLNAFNDGAIAVVICTPNDTLQGMPPGDADVSSVNVPCVMMKGSDCEILKVEFANGFMASLKEKDCDLTAVSYPANTIWGGVSGEGDFNGGLNGWSVDNGWIWTTKGQTHGAYGAQAQSASMTFCNGTMVFDSDFLDNGGDQNNINGGECPATSSSFCEGSLTSPSITIPADVSGVVLQFTQNTDQFQSEYYVVYSIDGGVTWADTIELNADLVPRTSTQSGPGLHPEITEVALSKASAGSNVVVKFWYRGNYYYWAIDDVILLDQAVTDLAPAVNWYARSPYNVMPVSQTDLLVFMTDVDNIGNADVANAQLNVKVVGPALNTLYDETLDYGVFEKGTAIDNMVLPETFQIPPVEGEYTIIYEMLGDDTPDNNKHISKFTVGGNEFSRIPNFDITSGWVPKSGGSDVHYTYGSVFYFPNDTQESMETWVKGTTFRIAPENANYSGFVTVELYSWRDIDGDGLVQATERHTIALNEDIYVSGDNGNNNIYEVEFEAAEGESLRLDLSGGDKTYILALHIAPGDGDGDYFIHSLNSSDGAGFTYNYDAARFAFDQLGIFRKQVIRAQGQSADDVEDRVFDSNSALQPRLPLFLDVVSGSEDLNKDISASITPNPVKDVVNIKLALNSVSKNVNVQLVSLDGKVVSNNDFSNVKSSTLKIDASKLTTGVYLANIRTNEGFISKRIVVQK